jgi:hypothetical protein
MRNGHLLEDPVVEELLTRDLVALDRIERNFFDRLALAAGFTGDVEGMEDSELAEVRLVVAAEERPTERFAVDGVVFAKSRICG